VKDFEDLAREQGWTIERRIFLAGHHMGRFLANLMAETAVFMLRR